MTTPWHELLTNVAIVAITTSVWTAAQRYFIKAPQYVRSTAFGALMALGAAGVMLLPVQFSNGVLLDLRYAFLAIAGFFGGPWAVILPVVASLTLRISQGGAGVWVGVPLILLATASGLVGFWRLGYRIPQTRHILALAAATAASGTAGFFVMIPISRWPVVIPNVTVPLGVLLFISTTVAAFALALEMRRQQASNENQMYGAIIEALPDCLNAKDLSGRFIAANPATAVLMDAASADDLIGKSDFDFYPAETAAKFRDDEQAFLQEARAVTVEQRFRRSNGAEAWLSTLKAPLFDGDGKLVGLITHNREITDQKRLEMQLVEAKGRLSDALASMADGLVMFDRDGNLVFSNEQYRDLFPMTADVRVPGTNLRTILRASAERGEEFNRDADLSEDGIDQRCRRLMQSGDGQLRLSDGRWLEGRTRLTDEGGCLVIVSDISKSKAAERQLLELNQRLEAMANTDGLTGLLNRRGFDRKLEEAISTGLRSGTTLSLFLIDIDRFKAFNDTYGHPEGDACLRAVSNCLGDMVKGHSGGVVARYGGEEIAIILPDLDLEGAIRLGEQLRTGVKSLAIQHTGSEKKIVTISIGVTSQAGTSISSPLDFIRHADEGLYAAKAAGRDRVRTVGSGLPVALSVV